MTSVIDILRGINAYPIPVKEIIGACEYRGVACNEDATTDLMKGKAFNLVKADLLLWLSIAPNVSQGGQSYSFSDQQRKDLRNQAQALYKEFEPDGSAVQKPIYGYKGSRL